MSPIIFRNLILLPTNRQKFHNGANRQIGFHRHNSYVSFRPHPHSGDAPYVPFCPHPHSDDAPYVSFYPHPH